jgi:hypothetical protein
VANPLTFDFSKGAARLKLDFQWVANSGASWLVFSNDGALLSQNRTTLRAASSRSVPSQCGKCALEDLKKCPSVRGQAPLTSLAPPRLNHVGLRFTLAELVSEYFPRLQTLDR